VGGAGGAGGAFGFSLMRGQSGATEGRRDVGN
jgi:hypothetical protein